MTAAKELVDALFPAVLSAGEVILRFRQTGFAVERKADASPVTGADRAAEAILLDALAAFAPGVPAVAEEQTAAGRVPDIGARFFLVDALDGTREFVSGGDDFTINIGLVENGVATFGLVYAPALDWMFATIDGPKAVELRVAPDAVGCQFAYCDVQHLVPQKADLSALRALISKSHLNAETQEFLERLNVAARAPVGSSLKFCLVARGDADLYPRFGLTSEWDTAAGHAILSAAGGVVLCSNGAELTYGKASQRFLNPSFVAWGQRQFWSESRSQSPV